MITIKRHVGKNCFRLTKTERHNGKKTQIPNMEEMTSGIYRQIADGPTDEISISKFDLDYAYGQLNLSKK